jgi:hypothetical protein
MDNLSLSEKTTLKGSIQNQQTKFINQQSKKMPNSR